MTVFWLLLLHFSAYLHVQGAGDQHVGRTVCGLNPNHSSFAVLPPCFVPDYDPKPLLRVLFSNFDGASPEFQKVLTMTTASVIYHMDWLRHNLEAGHPLFSTELFRIAADRPFSEMVECHEWRQGDVMHATGIPPHVTSLVKEDEMLKRLENMPRLVVPAVIQELESRNLLLTGPSKEELERSYSAVFSNVIEKYLGADAREILSERVQANLAQSQAASAPSTHPRLYLTEKNKMTRIPPDFNLPCGKPSNGLGELLLLE